MEDEEHGSTSSPSPAAGAAAEGSGDGKKPEDPAKVSGRPGQPAERPSSAPRESLRPSLPPSTGPGRNYRILLAALWIGTQVALVYTADRRSDGAFGFRMFNESSVIKVALHRELDGAAPMHVDGGVWSARGPDGTIRRFSWYDRVPRPYWLFDQDMHASYGAGTQLARLQGALDDVAAHVPEDAETRRLVLEVVVRRNGREPVTHRLTSKDRLPPREPHDVAPKDQTSAPSRDRSGAPSSLPDARAPIDGGP